MSKKPIIVFEGIEGSGKSFHIKNVENYLKGKKLSYVKFREPGGTTNSEKIRKLILKDKTNFNPTTDLLLYLASRSENVEKIIKKNLNKKIILIDRFIDWMIAYQHYGLNVNKKTIETLKNWILKKIKVDFTFLNTVNIRNLKKRLSVRKKLNRYDRFKFTFYSRVQKGFIKLSKKNKKKYLIVDSNKPIQFNKKIIINKVNKII